MTLVALLLSFSTHVTVRLAASLTAFLAAFLTFIAFVCDIALYAWVKHQVGKLEGVDSNTDTAPGALMYRSLKMCANALYLQASGSRS